MVEILTSEMNIQKVHCTHMRQTHHMCEQFTRCWQSQFALHWSKRWKFLSESCKLPSHSNSEHLRTDDIIYVYYIIYVWYIYIYDVYTIIYIYIYIYIYIIWYILIYNIYNVWGLFCINPAATRSVQLQNLQLRIGISSICLVHCRLSRTTSIILKNQHLSSGYLT